MCHALSQHLTVPPGSLVQLLMLQLPNPVQWQKPSGQLLYCITSTI